jgi:hypothetical protein
MELQFEFEITERSIAGEESAPAYAAVHLLSDMGPSRTIATFHSAFNTTTTKTHFRLTMQRRQNSLGHIIDPRQRWW